VRYRPKDAFYRRAKDEGYRSRAAYKLLELQRRFRLIRPGWRVVDLGAAPGGWVQVAAQAVGSQGMVLGVDLQEMAPFPEKNIENVHGDVTSPEVQSRMREFLGSSADCVLSDLSPRLSGIRDADISRSAELVRVALEVARNILRPGGHLVVKTFVGEETLAIAREMKEEFASVVRTRPEATRKGSSEIYLIGRGFRALREASSRS